MIGTRMHDTSINRRKAMVRCALAALAAVVLVGASLIPDDASARRAVAAATGGVEAFMAGLAVLASGPGICRPWICRSGLCRSRIRRSRIWISSGSAHGGPQRRLRCCSRRSGGWSLRLLWRRVQQRLPLQLLWRLGLPGSVWILNGLSACGRRSGPDACRRPRRKTGDRGQSDRWGYIRLMECRK